MKIVRLEASHYQEVKEIYEHGIATGNATFQTEAPSWEEWDKSHLPNCRLVALDENKKVIGWAALTPVSGRCVYAGVAEVSVYIHLHHQGKGIGKVILEELIRQSEEHNLWTVQAGIFPENKASLRLHEQLGFRKIGYREKIGKMKNVWRDTIQLERRSKRVGID
ncbi:MAG TPA: GNAT family N-acetyltransferase [Cyclobacteriaceae bacterium]|nr:GNAT family N-acetyltransferase [Cyclobacteriaceae bacterium]